MDAQDAPKSSATEPASKPAQPRSLRTIYLIFYNYVSAMLWFATLAGVTILVPYGGFRSVYPGVGQFTKWTQTLALLEVVHAAIGVVRAPISTTLMQVASRILLVWGVVNNFPFLAKSPGYSSMLVAWSVTEVIRYSYFTFTLSGYNPKPLTWLRYNTFSVLYPLGISSECWLIYKAIAPAKKIRQEFAWVLQLILVIYIPGSYILFTHMMAQRRKVMRGLKAKKTA